MNFQTTQAEWLKRRAELVAFWDVLERTHETLGERTDPGAIWARAQLEAETKTLTADLGATDAKFAEIEQAHAAYEAASAEVQRTAVTLDAPDKAHLTHLHARRAESAAAVAFAESSAGFVMPSVSQYPLHRGYMAFAASGLGRETRDLVAKAADLASFEPGGRNGGDASVAHTCARRAGEISLAHMVFELAAESAHHGGRLSFDVRWSRFAELNNLPSEPVAYPALPTTAERDYRPLPAAE